MNAWKISPILALLLLIFTQSACAGSAEAEPSSSPKITQHQPKAIEPTVHFRYAHDANKYGCGFKFSPTDFCNKKHIDAYIKAIQNGKANFNKKFILLSILDRPKYKQSSLVVINPSNGYVWPVPMDEYANLDKDYEVVKNPLEFSIHSNKFCINGTILVYRVLSWGKFCFEFDDGYFDGYNTQYMYTE